MTPLFTNAMDKVYRSIDLPSDQGDRLVLDELLADILCNLSRVSDIAAHIATCRAECRAEYRALHKTLCLRGMYNSATALFFQ